MKPRISMVALGVADLEVSIKFYREGLGLPMTNSPPGVAFFNLDGSWLGLSKRDDLAADATVSPEGRGYAGFNLVHNVASEREVRDVIQQAVAAGGSLAKAPQKASWGGYHAYFRDPDGHLWEVAYNPFAWIGPAD